MKLLGKGKYTNQAHRSRIGMVGKVLSKGFLSHQPPMTKCTYLRISNKFRSKGALNYPWVKGGKGAWNGHQGYSRNIIFTKN